jgi:hypothetical protein
MCDNNCENCVCNQEVEDTQEVWSDQEEFIVPPMPEEWKEGDDPNFFEELGGYRVGVTPKSLFVVIEHNGEEEYFGKNLTKAFLGLSDAALLEGFPGLSHPSDLDWIKESLEEAVSLIEQTEITE